MSRPLPKRADLPGIVPLFPIAGTYLLPRGQISLQVFEPRHIAMIDECLKTPGRLIGMIQPRPAPTSDLAEGGSPQLHSIGCVGRLTSFSEIEDGRYQITLTGMSRFRLDHLVEADTPYLQGAVDYAPFARDLLRCASDNTFDREEFLFLLGRFYGRRRQTLDWETLSEGDDEMLINGTALVLPLDAAEKQALLEAPTLTDRRETLMALMEFSLISEHIVEERRQ